jgi:urease subunit gamma/beta
VLLTPTELERLTIYTAAELARKCRAKGLKLNHLEGTAIIADEILAGAREGRSVADLISFGSTILSTDDVMPGLAELMPVLAATTSASSATSPSTRSTPRAPSASTSISARSRPASWPTWCCGNPASSA